MGNQLQNSNFDGFFASDRLMDKWKSNYAKKEQQIVGEAGDISAKNSVILDQKATKRISNMGKSGFFFKALYETGLGQKGKQAKIGEKAKQHFTIAFLSL